MTLRNLEQKDQSKQDYQDSDDSEIMMDLKWKWILVNSNQNWAKKLWILLERLNVQNKKLYNAFLPAEILQDVILGPFIGQEDEDGSDDSDGEKLSSVINDSNH